MLRSVRYFQGNGTLAGREGERGFGCQLGRPLLEAIARESISLAQKFEAAPEIPSYEKFLIEKAGYGRLMARLMAHQICH